MRKSLLLIVLLGMSLLNSYAEITPEKDFQQLERKVSVLQQSNLHLISNVRELIRKNKLIQANIDSLQSLQLQQAERVKVLAEKTGADISDANQKIDTNVSTLSDSIKSRTWIGVISIMIAITLLALTYYILRRKISSGASTIDKIRTAQEGLEAAQKSMQEEAVKLDSKLLEMLDKQLTMGDVKETDSSQPDHRFALKVGDELAKIETNLSKMDPTVKGYKQLKQAVQRIKDNFNSNGYEIVDLLGLDYNDGMPFEAQFVPDDTLPEGKRVISGITRLQINYNGEMIQSAKIVVRQNI